MGRYAQDISIDPEAVKAGGAALGGGLLGYLAQKNIDPDNAFKRVQKGYIDNIKQERGLKNSLKHVGSALLNGYNIFPPTLGGGIPVTMGSIATMMAGHPYLGLGMLGAQTGSSVGNFFRALSDKNYFKNVKQSNSNSNAQNGNGKWITTKTGKKIFMKE